MATLLAARSTVANLIRWPWIVTASSTSAPTEGWSSMPEAVRDGGSADISWDHQIGVDLVDVAAVEGGISVLANAEDAGELGIDHQAGSRSRSLLGQPGCSRMISVFIPGSSDSNPSGGRFNLPVQLAASS